MTLAKITTTAPIDGVVDDAVHENGKLVTPGTAYQVPSGTYDVEQIDDVDVYIVVDDVPDVCVIVNADTVGLVPCPGCSGRGEIGYRISVDEWESDECGCCDGDGLVTPEAAAATQDMIDEARAAESAPWSY